MSIKHPAKYSKPLIPIFAEAVRGCDLVLDPMAGTGRIHLLPNHTVGVEIEPEWATMHPDTIVGDALYLPFGDDSFDGINVSPTYSNRFADHHKAKDGSLRRSYTHDLGHDLHPNNSGSLHWGEPYREFHRRAWKESKRVLKPGGIFVLNIKDHIRRGEIQPVSKFHRDYFIDVLGFTLLDAISIPLPGMRCGANGAARVENEWIFVFRNGAR